MAEYHARPRKAHNGSDFLTHFGLVAMDAAVGAKGLGFHKGTLIAPHHSVFGQRLAFGTKCFLCPVLLFAIEAYHQGDRAFFSFALGFNLIFAHTFYLPLHDRYDLRSPS